MGKTLGPATYPRQNRPMFLSPEQASLGGREYSEATAGRIDVEVKEILEAADIRVDALLAGKRDVLNRVATALLDKETLDEAAFKELIG